MISLSTKKIRTLPLANLIIKNSGAPSLLANTDLLESLSAPLADVVMAIKTEEAVEEKWTLNLTENPDLFCLLTMISMRNQCESESLSITELEVNLVFDHTKLTMANVMQIFRAAHAMDLAMIEERCEFYLSENLAKFSFADVVRVATTFRREKLLHLLADNWWTSTQHRSFEIPPDLASSWLQTLESRRGVFSNRSLRYGLLVKFKGEDKASEFRLGLVTGGESRGMCEVEPLKLDEAGDRILVPVSNIVRTTSAVPAQLPPRVTCKRKHWEACSLRHRSDSSEEEDEED